MSHFLFSVSTSIWLWLRFTSSRLEHKTELALLLIMCPVASPGYLAGDWRVESRCLSYILPHRFSVRDESHRIGRSFVLGASRKTHQSFFFFFFFFFIKRTEPTLLFTAFATSLKSQTRCSPPSSHCPRLLPHLHRSLHQKFHPMHFIVSLLRTYLTLNRDRSSLPH